MVAEYHKELTGEIVITNQSPAIFIEDSWNSIGKFKSELNSYYLQDHMEIEFPEIPTVGSSITVNELEIYCTISSMT